MTGGQTATSTNDDLADSALLRLQIRDYFAWLVNRSGKGTACLEAIEKEFPDLKSPESLNFEPRPYLLQASEYFGSVWQQNLKSNLSRKRDLQRKEITSTQKRPREESTDEKANKRTANSKEKEGRLAGASGSIRIASNTSAPVSGNNASQKSAATALPTATWMKENNDSKSMIVAVSREGRTNSGSDSLPTAADKTRNNTVVGKLADSTPQFIPQNSTNPQAMAWMHQYTMNHQLMMQQQHQMFMQQVVNQNQRNLIMSNALPNGFGQAMMLNMRNAPTPRQPGVNVKATTPQVPEHLQPNV